MSRRRAVIAGLAVILVSGLAAGPAHAANIVTVAGLNPSSGLSQTGRIDPDGIQSDCDAVLPIKFEPELTGGSSQFNYRIHTLRSVLVDPVCIDVDVNTACTGNDALFSAAYVGDFDPLNPLTRYAADQGDTQGMPYSFTVPGEGRFAVVVHHVSATGACMSYGLSLDSRGPWANAAPSIVDGPPAVGTVIRGVNATWIETPVVAQRWRRCDTAGANCSDIPGATGATYTVTDADLGHTLRFRNRATDTAATNTSDSAFVEPFIQVDARPNESLGAGDRVQNGVFVRDGNNSHCGAPTTAPTILQPANNFLYDAWPVRSLLNEPVCLVAHTESTCASGVALAIYNPFFSPTAGLDTNYAGNSGDSFVAPALAATTLAPGASGEIVVSVGGGGGNCGRYGLIYGADAPFATARPAVTGTPAEGGTLTASDGAWSGTPALGRAWLRCDADGNACAPIDGAAGASYTPTAADVGRRLRMRVTATQGRSVSSDSEPTGIVAAAPSQSGPAGGGGASGAPPDRTGPKARLALARTTLQKVVKSGRIPVTVTCDEACTVTLRADVTRKLGRRLGGVKIASGKGTGRAGRKTTLKLKLTRKARKALRRQKSVAFTLKATAADASGNRASANKKARIRRKR